MFHLESCNITFILPFVRCRIFVTRIEALSCHLGNDSCHQIDEAPAVYSVDRLVSFQHLISFRRDPTVGKFRILRSEVLVRDLLARIGVEQRTVGERLGFDSEDSMLGVVEKLHRNGRRRNDMPGLGFGKSASRQRSGPASKGFGRRRFRELQVERIALGFGNDQCVIIHSGIGI